MFRAGYITHRGILYTVTIFFNSKGKYRSEYVSRYERIILKQNLLNNK
jgi:hypothetical protein